MRKVSLEPFGERSWKIGDFGTISPAGKGRRALTDWEVDFDVEDEHYAGHFGSYAEAENFVRACLRKHDMVLDKTKARMKRR